MSAEIPETNRTPASSCPTCKYEMDAATCLTHKEAQASPGDVSVCLKCGEILEFDGDLKLVPARVDTMLKLDPSASKLLRRVQELIRKERPVE